MPQGKSKAAPLPLSSVHLLVSPVRLMSAFIWRVVQQRHVMQYEKVVDFITLTTDLVPELLSPSRRTQLILGLRARVVLELCRGDGLSNLQTIQSHLDKIHNFGMNLSSTDELAEVQKTSYTNFTSLVQKLLNVPIEKEFFFQEVFPVKYGSAYNQSLQQLLAEFLSRLDQLLPEPHVEQAAAWLSEAACVSDDFGLYLSQPFAFKTLLLHHRQLGTLSPDASSSENDVILSTLGLPSPASKYVEPFSEGDDYDSEEDSLALEDLEDSTENPHVTVGDWLPTKKTVLCLFICPQCSFAHSVKREVQEHIQTEHQTQPTAQLKQSISTSGAKRRKDQKKVDGNSKKKRESKQKDGFPEKSEQKQKKSIVENNVRQRRKDPTTEDKRFLSRRPLDQNFSQEQTACPKCEKVFDLPNQLKTHMKLHTLPFHCSQCEKGFKSPSGYYQHQRVHKRGRTFICSRCNKGFLCSYSLKQHERSHAGPTNLCTICGRSFSKAGITRHMRMHKGEKNFLCTVCGKPFLSSGELLLHTRSHTGETPYTCTHCGKGFSCKSHLIVHVRSHTGERPYVCSLCPKRFLTVNCLKRHTLSHNGVKPFKCTHCDKEFSQQGNLKRHMTTHKPDT